jgi:hypothetical protein
MAGERVCVVKLTDDPTVKVRAESVYEAALLGLNRLERMGWESDGSTIGSAASERPPYQNHAGLALFAGPPSE